MAEEFIFDIDSVWVVALSTGVTGDEGCRVIADPAAAMWVDTPRGRATVLFTDEAGAADFADKMQLSGVEAVTFASRRAVVEFLTALPSAGIGIVAFDPVAAQAELRIVLTVEEVLSGVQRTVNPPE